MRIFISAGEPSGDLHGANLARSLQRLHPEVELVGFGGDRMAAAGVQLLYPLCQLAVMWIVRVLANIGTFLGLLSQADRYFRHRRPDAVVLIDYPGFHWWLARRAHFHGIPVFYFVPPQIWAWAPWRIAKMRRWVDHVLCTLPFEEPWYRERGVDARFIGHPYFDELAEQRFDEAFLAEQRADNRPLIALLPGSRQQEIERNLSSIVRAARRVHAARPDVRFLFACYKESQRQRVAAYVRRWPELPVEVHAGRTPEIIRLAHACVAVSGSVGLELLGQTTPTVVVYRVGPVHYRIARWLAHCRYMSLVNLLADRELYPEYPTVQCEAEAIAGHLLHWLDDPAAWQARKRELADLRRQVAIPGACERAAMHVLSALAGERQQAA
jgi:lipid-A-disaccharide synthase